MINSGVSIFRFLYPNKTYSEILSLSVPLCQGIQLRYSYSWEYSYFYKPENVIYELCSISLPCILGRILLIYIEHTQCLSKMALGKPNVEL